MGCYDLALQLITEHRAAFLTKYQDAPYSARYRALVSQVHKAELPLGSEAMSTAVARSLFKLMAYKDEYEVPRLHTSAAFLDQIKQRFSGDFSIKYHLAPPVISFKKDARGRPLKREMGAWMSPVFRALCKFKRLRGSKLDLFGYTAERKMERELMPWYESVVHSCLRELSADNHALLTDVLSQPLHIRGYGPVKLEAIEKVQADVGTALTQLSGRND